MGLEPTTVRLLGNAICTYAFMHAHMHTAEIDGYFKTFLWLPQFACSDSFVVPLHMNVCVGFLLIIAMCIPHHF